LLKPMRAHQFAAACLILSIMPLAQGRKLFLLPFGDDQLLGNQTAEGSSSRYLLRHMLMFDDHIVEYVGASVDKDGLKHECRKGMTPVPADGRQADHIWKGYLEPLGWNASLVLLGVHDCFKRSEVQQVMESFSTLERMVEFLQEDGRKVFVGKLPPHPDTDINDCVQTFNGMIDEVFGGPLASEGSDVTIVDFDLDVRKDIDRTGLVPNKSGQEKMAGAWYAALTSWMRSPAAPRTEL